MKLLFSLPLLLASVNAFTTNLNNPAFSRTSVVVEGSRNKQKIASRQKWAEARGYDTALEEETVEDVGGILANDDGLSYIRLMNDNGDTSDIYLFGGVVTSYVKEGQEYIAVRPDAKMDGSKPISGGLSHCWPQFGPGAIQQHGFARNVNWEVKELTPTTVELELAPSEYTKSMWDKQFSCSFTVTLNGDDLNTKMVVKNVGEEESFDFQAALHSYFTVSALDNLEITGSFKGKEFLNKLAGDDGEMQTEERDAIVISEEYDRVYTGVNDPVLNDKGTGKALSVVNTAGYADTVLWNPYGEEGMGFNNFVCVESAKYDAVTLAAGESWTGEMSLKPSIL